MSISFGCILVAGILAIQLPLSESVEQTESTPQGEETERKNPFAPSERIRSLQKPAESEPSEEPENSTAVPLLVKGLVVDQNGKAVALLEVDGKVHFVRSGTTIESTSGSIQVEAVSDQSVKVLIGPERDPQTVRFASTSRRASAKVE